MDIKNGKIRFLVFTLVGGILGFGVSYASSQMGSTCSIMCNPMYALAFGGLIGAIMAFDKPTENNE